jgi:hypothetical protein
MKVKMKRIVLIYLMLCLHFLTFAQEKKQEKWERVISEMTKANQGDTLTYRTQKKLAWSDFKMLTASNNTQNYNIELTFGVFKKKVNIWTGTLTVESYGGMRKDLSWVSAEHKSEQLLNYLQMKYEIADYFAKKSEKEINSNKINAGNTNKVNGIIDKFLEQRDKVLNQLDIESANGTRLETIESWKNKQRTGEL